ncbi:hypothetical protein [Parasphingorhabdus sp.]|uniref:hypothetical protein n=1 Tax=Parasphingorhabdus sp. TaxID=2709688 RepID=UPI002F92FAEB
MIKKAALFVISAAFLVYFIAPVEEEQKPQPTEIKAEQKPVSAPSKDADYWGDDAYGEDSDEQEFVFGEPMMSTDPIIDTDEFTDNRSEDGSGDERETASSSTNSSQNRPSAPAKSRPIHSSSPKPGELGSAENPILLN